MNLPAQGEASPRGLRHEALAEAVGTGFLAMAVIGSGIAASRLSADDPGLQLLQASIATGAVLTALILALGSVSAAFNPLVSLLGALLGDLRWGHAGVLVAAQVVGAVTGVVLANVMFGLGAVGIGDHARSGSGSDWPRSSPPRG